MRKNYFASLLPELNTRAARSVVSILGFSNKPLRRHLLKIFSSDYGTSESFLGDPVFEATFGWQTGDKTMSQLSGKLLHPRLVDAMDKPWGESAKDYCFLKKTKPYTHQIEAWTALLQSNQAHKKQSVVITSGTGSGKTECFMIPILSSIAQSKENKKYSSDHGSVQAIFLYPLNALIQSQRERLRAWTGSFGKDIRFCLYNGNTPEKAPAHKTNEAPNEVHDRANLRENPPDILVTNPTMLEYMLVRAEDSPILEKSKGKLQWIVLDEAHNYIGSSAAELALLLRRVLHAFGASAEKVHFIATSATIGAGDDNARKQLQEFLSRLAGIQSDQVTVVYGERSIPDLSHISTKNSETLDSLEFISNENNDFYQRLSENSTARRLRDLFIPKISGENYQSLSAIKTALHSTDTKTALRWLDVLTNVDKPTPFLPLRLHAFHNTLSGLWACCNSDCNVKQGTDLDDPEWKFGAIYTIERKHCTCSAPVYPLVSCNDCNETYLLADSISANGIQRIVAPTEKEEDEFMLERDNEESLDSSDAENMDGISSSNSLRSSILISNGKSSHYELIDAKTLSLVDKPTETTFSIGIQDINEDNVLECPECKASNKKIQKQYRSPRLGAPFHLSNIIPTLLEFCPDGESPLAQPRRGRRLITFTDSRQGTARIAAKLQQDAERNAMRAAVYRKLVSSTAASSGEQDKLRNDINALKSVNNSILLPQIQEKEKQLQQLEQSKPISHNDMVAYLAADQSSDISKWIHASYEDSDTEFSGGKGKELIAKILLCREFGRRPKRQNSLETLGLVSVQYPKLQNISTLRSIIKDNKFTLDEWRSFLKITLDFFVRQYWAIQLPLNWQRWGAEKVYPKEILPPKSKEKSTSKLVHWPKVMGGKQRQSRLIRILACVLKIDPQTDSGRDRIDALLLAAWHDLVNAGLLQQRSSGRYLDFVEDVSFQNISKAWLCPVTRRVLDVTFRGITPYLPEKIINESMIQCQAIEIPICNDIAKDDYANEDARIEAVRNWVLKQDILQNARIEGYWSNLNERIIEGAGYFKTAEHSAQQSSQRLEKYERDFKQGKINLMSCSTTMEMGVDIGGITMVSMNNVPPHPANYLQRAGRAGRRSETRSVALTVCKNNSHDQMVFKNTNWPFTTRLRTPRISLDSPLLVQRHINSMILAYFLKCQSREGKLNKLTLEWWMLPKEKSYQERFVAWCDCYQKDDNPELHQGITSLIQRTILEGRNIPALVKEAGKFISDHAKVWNDELDSIQTQIESFGKKDKDNEIPLKSLEIQKKRLINEYLLRELATSGILPGYGFPTDITTFETLNKDSREIQYKREITEKEGREDNRFQRRELPSRDTVTALREYAPGAKVVIDGLVYESAGISLNWHIPATSIEVNELQNIRQAWRCKNCGSSGTFVLAKKLNSCPECNEQLDFCSNNSMQYLEPAGFSVDISAETHNDIAEQLYMPVEQPWISATGTWMPLANPQLGCFRSTRQGSVFHYSSGANRSGYALCLECGRTASMGSDGENPPIFENPHRRLRGGKTNGAWQCAGSHDNFKIKRGIRFGREYTTDVLEILLQDTDGQPLQNSIIAYTLAVVLRRAIAEYLGIDETELGCNTKQVREISGKITQAIQIFDIRSAGYSSIVSNCLPDLFRLARKKLECPSDCLDACQSCLLTFDTRHESDNLNRHAALKFLTDGWMDSLALDEKHRLLGEESKAEFQPLNEAIHREINTGNICNLYIYLDNELSEWELAGSPLQRLLRQLSPKEEITIYLMGSWKNLNNLSRENTSIITNFQKLCNLKLHIGTSPQVNQNGVCLVSLEHHDGSCTTWATTDKQSAECGKHWGILGITQNHILVTAPSALPIFQPESLQLPLFNSDGFQSFSISNELDGKGSGFGKRFLTHLGNDDVNKVFPTQHPLIAIYYMDRYLATPISCAILVEVLSALKNYYESHDQWAVSAIGITTMYIDVNKTYRSRNNAWWNDWDTTERRDEALKAACTYSGMNAFVTSKSKKELSHSRSLVLQYQNGSSLTIWLDQGFSYWSVNSEKNRTRFDMNLSIPDLGAALGQISVDIKGHEISTQIFMEYHL